MRFFKRTFAMVALLMLFSGIPAVLAQDSFQPTLSIPIPTVTFSTIKVQEADEASGVSGYVDVPWIAQYIQGVYLFGVSVAGIIVSVTIVIGGFQYMTGKPAEGKEKIKRSLTGMVLIFGSYIILQTINPDLTKLTSLKIATVKRLDFGEMLTTTTEVTSTDDGPSSRRSTLGTGTYKPAFTTCPYVKEGDTDEKLRSEFFEQVLGGGFIHGASTRDRATEVAELALLCKIKLGSCGQTAGTIQSLASIADGTNTKTPCFQMNGVLAPTCIHTHGKMKKSVNAEQHLMAYGWLCETFTGPHDKKWDKYKRPDCVADKATAKLRVATYMQNQAISGKAPGWPDEWLKTLVPGDYVILYTGNKDLTGSHAVTFLGWSKDGWMQAVGGNIGQVTGISEYCVASSCKGHMTPLLEIHSALP